MRLRYPTMIEGIPGTGTRDGGLSGALLKVNLDGIVLLRFHHLCLRVCFFAMVVYILIVLPIYATSNDTEDAMKDFNRLTLANVPTLKIQDTDNIFDVVSIYDIRRLC